VTPKGLLGYVHKKVSPQISQDRVSSNVFDLQNDFHEDQLSFSGRKNKIGLFKAFFEASRTKSPKFLTKLGLKSWKIGR
jgi:hypothetical protein